MNPNEVSTDIAILEQHNMNVQQIEDQYGDGLPYDYNRLVAKGQGVAQLAYQSMQELGRICLRIKAHEPHGKYEQALEMMSVSKGDAWFAVQAVVKIGEVPEVSPVKLLGKRKLRSILQLDAPTIKTYLEGGDLESIPHDAVAAMSSRALETEVRNLREERKKLNEEHEKQLAAIEEVVRKKESKISELEMEVAGRQPPTKEQVAEGELNEIRKEILQQLSVANGAVNRLRELADKAQKVDGVNVDQLDHLVEQVSDIYGLLSDNWEDFNQDMENIRPAREA